MPLQGSPLVHWLSALWNILHNATACEMASSLDTIERKFLGKSCWEVWLEPLRVAYPTSLSLRLIPVTAPFSIARPVQEALSTHCTGGYRACKTQSCDNSFSHSPSAMVATLYLTRILRRDCHLFRHASKY